MSYLLPLGPFDRTWRGPQRVVLQVDGERVSGIEHQDGFHARGCAERLRGLPLQHSYPLVNRVCGVHSHHHALAWTMVQERLAGIEVPERAEVLRALVAEVERIASHLYDASRIVALLGLDGIFRRLFDLRELALQAGQTLTGHRLTHDFVRPGGVEHDLHSDERVALHALLTAIAGELRKLLPALLTRSGLKRRGGRLGMLQPGFLTSAGIAGWIARAAGINADLRRDQPYGVYRTDHPPVVVQVTSDVHGRLMTLLAEAYESAEFSLHILADLPDGRWRGDLLDAVPAGTAMVSVEAPSGVLTYHVVSDGARLIDVRIVSGPRPAHALLRAVLAGTLVDDAALVVASLALCTACAEV